MNTVYKTLVSALLLFAGLFTVTPASAHTEIDHTSPSANSSVEAGTQTISVVFTDKILNLANSSEVVITDANGDEVATSCLEVKKTSLNIEAFLGAAGDYKVVWRTVAEDGHPISGDFGFTVTGSAEDSAFVNCKALASQGTAITAPEPKAIEEKPEASNSAIVWPYWITGFVLLIAWLVVAIRRRKTKG